MINKVEICGINTAKLPVLREREKMELLKKMQEGDPNAREALVSGNLRLVLSVIQRFANRGENLDDLFQVGCIGLIKAIDHFDISQGVRFSTYAVPIDVRCRNGYKSVAIFNFQTSTFNGNFSFHSSYFFLLARAVVQYKELLHHLPQ